LKKLGIGKFLFGQKGKFLAEEMGLS